MSAPLTPYGEIDALGERLVDVLIEAQRLNADGMSTRSRELSLAITNVEQGIHWIQAILHHATLQRTITVNGEEQTG